MCVQSKDNGKNPSPDEYEAKAKPIDWARQDNEDKGSSSSSGGGSSGGGAKGEPDAKRVRTD